LGVREILIVEDQAIMREGLRALLSNCSGIKVVGEAADGCLGVRMFKKLHPDVVLMDLSMPKMNGIESLKQIKRVKEEARVLMLSVHNTEEYGRAVLKAGADGYIQKDCSSAELVKAINDVFDGRTYIYPSVSEPLVQGYGDGKTRDKGSSWDSLTDRERQVLKLVAEGYRNREIAEFLFICPKTVEKHRTNLMKKLDLHSVAALTTYCLQRGLVGPAESDWSVLNPLFAGA